MAFFSYVQNVPLDLSKDAAIGTVSTRSEASTSISFLDANNERYMPITIPYRSGILPFAVHQQPSVSRPVPLNYYMPHAVRESGAECGNRCESDICPRTSYQLSPTIPHISPELPQPAVRQTSTVSPRSSMAVRSESLSDDEGYLAFEKDALDEIEKSDGALLRSNPRMRRQVQTTQEDEGYRQRRLRNNIAAKQSRNRRKLREIRTKLKVVYLNQQIATAKAVLATRTCQRCSGPRPAPA